MTEHYRLLDLPVVKEWVNNRSSSNGLLAHFVTVGVNERLKHHTRRELLIALWICVPVRTTVLLVVGAVHDLQHKTKRNTCVMLGFFFLLFCYLRSSHIHIQAWYV